VVTSEHQELERDHRTAAARRRLGRIMGAVTERGSSAFGLLLIAFWTGTASLFQGRRAARPAAQPALDRARPGLAPAAGAAWEPLSAAWREPGLTLTSRGLRHS
jgi:hypothetical protein